MTSSQTEFKTLIVYPPMAPSREDYYRDIEEYVSKDGWHGDEIVSLVSSYYENKIDCDTKKAEILEIFDFIDNTGAVVQDRDIAEIVGCGKQYVKHLRLDRRSNGERSYFQSSETVPENLKKKVFSRDGDECVRCGKSENLVCHHIIPVKDGGDTQKDNLATLCNNCHLEAHGGSFTNPLSKMGYRTTDGFWNWVQKD